MRRPTRRTPSRGQRSPRRPTPLPSRPVRGGPKGPPVRAVPKNPPKPRPVRGGRRITEKPRGPKTRPNTGTSTKTAQLQKRAQAQAQLDAVKKTTSNIGTSTKTNAQPRTLQPAKVQPQVTAAERKQMEAALRARVAKAPDKQAAAKTAELQKRLFNDAQKAASKNARPKTPAAPPTGSRAAAIRRRRRRGGGGLAGALRRRRARIGR